MSQAYDMNPGPNQKFKCDDCGKTWRGYELRAVKNLLQRLDVGGEVPGGECPIDGNLCYLIKNDK